MRISIFYLLACILLCTRILAEPTGEREWRSTAGTEITADAIAIKDGTVYMKTNTGREIQVPMDKLVDEDRDFLLTHFEVPIPKPGDPVGSSSILLAGGLPHPAGVTSGPIDAGDGSLYFVYIPKTLREGRKAPLMFYTGSGGGNERSVKTYTEAAELNGWVIAASVESKNGAGWEINHEHAKRCVEHLLEALPIDEERVYFSGSSGGGAMSFYNALRIKSAGNMPYIGYSRDRKYEKKQYCYGIGGTNDYNRYLTANAVLQFGDRGFHRMAAGGHSGGPSWIGNEGIVWLNGRFLGDNRKEAELNAERLDFEASIITWIKILQEDTPYRAHYWCQFLLDDYALEGRNAELVTKLIEELAKETNNVRYTEGIAAINKFSNKHYAPVGEGGGSMKKHNTPDIESAAEKLAADYIGVPEIEEITKRLGEPTV